MTDPADRGPVFDGVKMGYDLSLTRAPIEPIKKLLATMRAKGYHIIHTREGHRPDLTDLPANLDGLLALHGVGPKAVRVLRQALEN